jgi:phosphonopyruvate decarboxylase
VIEADDFLAPARARGFDFYTGVPCSFLTPLIDAVIGSDALTYVGAASEGEAVAIAAGAWLTGRQTVVMCQNSGLGNTVNPLTSLNYPFRIPTLLIVTWRGEPGIQDEPQHELMGRITGDLLRLIGVSHLPFPRSLAEVAPCLDAARKHMAETGLAFGLIMRKDSVRGPALKQAAPNPTPRGARHDRIACGARPTRARALERFLAIVPQDAGVIATTGKCGRELFTLADRDAHLYQVGSMGGASAMALGVALNSSRKIVVLDGDGAALMKLGNFATIGAYKPNNLVHVLLDNGAHDSTGGQQTVSATVDFSDVALAAGYRSAYACDDLKGFEESLKAAFASPGPSLVHLRIAPGSLEFLGRPTVAPHEVAQRFKHFLKA